MNVFTTACLMIWTSLSIASTFLAPNPWFGLTSLALNVAAWFIFTGPDNLDRPDERQSLHDRTNLRDTDRW